MVAENRVKKWVKSCAALRRKVFASPSSQGVSAQPLRLLAGLSRLWVIFRYYPTQPIEVALSVLTLAFGVLFWTVPYSLTFPAFTLMNALMPHGAWGLLLVCCGIWKLIVVAVDSKYRQMTAQVMCCLWVTISLLIARHQLSAPPLLSSCSAALQSAWVWWRLWQSDYDKTKAERLALLTPPIPKQEEGNDAV